MNKAYRCGWCGNPTTERGTVLNTKKIDLTLCADYSKAEAVNGECCTKYGYNDEAEFEEREPSQEMLMDAGII